jgi:lysozyme
MRSYRYMADISSNNGEISIPHYSRAGHAIIAIKATQFTNYVNPYHLRQASEAHDFGLTVVHYHYCQLGQTQQQINHFRNNYLKAWRDGDYICFDIEESDLDLNFSRDILGKAMVQTGHIPLLYSYRNDLETRLLGIKGYKKWVADYSENPIPYRVFSRQYTDGKYGPEPHFYSGIGKSDGSVVSAGPALVFYIRKLRTRKRK